MRSMFDAMGSLGNGFVPGAGDDGDDNDGESVRNRYRTIFISDQHLASGTPVAAYPVDGPLEVLGKPDGSCHGGVMDADLQQACYSALAVPRHEARARALDFSWAQAAQLFESYLVAAQNTAACKPVNAGASSVKSTVTSLSSNQ